MGAWGAGSFENDDALDWLYSLDNATDLSPLRSEFERLLKMEDQPESPDASAVLAAGEILSALRGKPPEDEFPADAQSYIDRVKTPPDDDLFTLAYEAIQRVRRDSELRDLWEEANALEEWQQAVDSLLARLG